MFEDYQKLMDEAQSLTKSANNPFFKSKYTELNDVLSEVKSLCIKNNFIFMQYPVVIEGKNYLKTVLTHKDGKSVEACIELVSKDESDPQKLGSAITYMRRYSLISMFGLEQDDDDGNKASTSKKVKTEVKQSTSSQKGDGITTCKECGEEKHPAMLNNYDGYCKSCVSKM
jgi:hypothetical protein